MFFKLESNFFFGLISVRSATCIDSHYVFSHPTYRNQSSRGRLSCIWSTGFTKPSAPQVESRNCLYYYCYYYQYLFSCARLGERCRFDCCGRSTREIATFPKQVIIARRSRGQRHNLHPQNTSFECVVRQCLHKETESGRRAWSTVTLHDG